MLEFISSNSGMVEQEAGGCSINLPWRRNERVYEAAGTPIVLGLICVGLGVLSWRWQPVAGGGLALLGLASWVCALGFFASRSRAKISDSELLLWERVGLVCRRRSRSRDKLRQFRVHRLIENGHRDHQPNAVLEVVAEGAPSLWFAAGYPYENVLELAAVLAEGCGVPVAIVPDDDESPIKITPFFEDPLGLEDNHDVPEQPRRSRMVVDAVAEGTLVLRMPPLERWKAAAWLVPGVAVFWLIFGDLPAGVREAVYAGVALLHLVIYWHLRSRWKVLAFDGDTLSMLQTGGLLPTKKQHWQAADILAVRVGANSSDEGEDLHLVLRGGTIDHLFAGESGAELRWLATLLRRALGVSSEARPAS